MLLFQKRFHVGLLDGSITLTFRQWQRPRVKVGGRYRVHPLGVLEVDAVELVTLGQVTPEDARDSGFESVEAFRQYVRRDAEIPPPDSLPLVRVRFHHGGDGDRTPDAMRRALTAAELDVLRRKLERLDALAPKPWTRQALELIRRFPKRRAGDLAERMGREKLAFKADVIKLKRLGLTQSFEVGYGLTPRGETFLNRLTRAAAGAGSASPSGSRPRRAGTGAPAPGKRAGGAPGARARGGSGRAGATSRGRR